MAHSRKNIPRFTPPVLLAIETATMCGSIALVADGCCLAEQTLQSGLTHSRRLLAGIASLMQESGISWSQIDGLAVSLGPGSFTGLRIGLSTVKGLAMATEKPVLGIPTLDGLASQICQSTGLICPVFDARKKEVYTALYRGRETASGGPPERLTDYLAIRPEALCEMISEPVLMVGDGLEPYGELFRERLAGLVTMAPAALYYPRGAAIGLLAQEKWRNKEFLAPATAGPIYVRPSEAEINFGKGKK